MEAHEHMGAGLTRKEIYEVVRRLAKDDGGADIINHYLRNEFIKTDMRHELEMRRLKRANVGEVAK